MHFKEVLKSHIAHAVDTAGVYRFYNKNKELLYVGKAKNLKKRLSSYLLKQKSLRITSLVSQIDSVETTTTNTENEALLLERNVIKAFKPHYNVLLRDDKSYPYLMLTEHNTYPRLIFYRGKPTGKAEYFGPYSSLLAVRETLNFLQKLFHIRNCRDSFFKNRTRPCIQYQIKRCSAPCVGFISKEEYQTDIHYVRLFLRGKNVEVIQHLTSKMDNAVQEKDYENAIKLRDQIGYLRQIQQQQSIITSIRKNVDVIVAVEKYAIHCVYVLPVHNGEVMSGEPYFPKVPLLSEKNEILSAFISQFYLQENCHTPSQIVTDTRIENQMWLMKSLSIQHQKKISLTHHPNKIQSSWLKLASQNALQALEQFTRSKNVQRKQREALQNILKLSKLPERIECFDVSHTGGENTVAACIVFNLQGPLKSEYRSFNLQNITPGDDYAGMKQALSRHYKKSIQRNTLPDLLIIDGGKGQLTQAIEVLTSLELINKIDVIAIAKGPTRKPGDETFFVTERKISFVLPADDSSVHLLQKIRDEAHRFAITRHRRKRAKVYQKTSIENIPSIGLQRRRLLLTQFGGLQGLKAASVQTLCELKGISTVLAQKIHAALRE